jgi:cellulose synthase/poly-beta-1,6-N-acetylglucosamine synthase-like glycosyltransferase/peptidoglycan/xylan/chitin deacetylase (PgdA/CDA1 family)/spore germination protein YaaH
MFSLFKGDTLPSLNLPEQKRPYHALREREREKPIKKRAAPRKRTAKGTIIPPTAGEPMQAAFYVAWDAGSFASLKQNYQHLDLLFPEWLHVLTPDGRVMAVNSDYKLFPILSGGTLTQPDDKVMPFLQTANSEVEVLPLVNNFDPVAKEWLTNIGDFLSDPKSRQIFHSQINQLMASDKYGGITIDFEEIPFSAQPGFRQLIADLWADFHPRGLKLYVNVPVDDKDYDYKFFSDHVDGLILMNYDEHQSSGGPGPVASQEWFTKNLRDAVKVVPPAKLVCAIGAYGYDWALEVDKRGRTGKVKNVRTVSAQEAWLTSSESEEPVQLDPNELNAHIAFMEEDNLRHEVWFLDSITAYNQMKAASALGVNAFALWRLGSEDRALWRIWENPNIPDFKDQLADVPPGQDVDLEGSGEILHIEQRPEHGTRSVTVDADTGLINSETFSKLPKPYQIAQYGSKPKKIAITFDDGPDPKFTPQILDILKAENVKATFFLIGVQAEKYSDVTHRVYDEGHEIGNHTFTHPDISSIGQRYMNVELNLTELLFASMLGVKPVYFRPPYSVDQEPDTADQVRPLEAVQSRGYITVGDKIDPNDWREQPPRDPEEITSEVMAQLDRGNIILLHDGGGDRGPTVKALPLIIKGLRDRGYEVVPVSTLLGKTRAEVMPPVPADERITARVDRLVFWAAAFLNSTIVLIFFMGDFLMSGRMLLVGGSAIFDRLHRSPALPYGTYQPTVAVLIPAYNEEKVIERTVRSVLASDYKNVRVIVIDDGSKDATYEVVRKAFAKEIAEDRVIALHKENSGKASAANFGLQHLQEEIFVAIDADTVIAPDAISRMVPHFADARTGAIAGNAKVGNRINLWTRWQALEYITSQNFERRALNTLGAVSVVPGAIGAWRTSAVREVGGYPHDTVAEDADLTMSLLQHGYKVHYEDRALAYTEAPMNADGLMRQRFRWSFGILQAMFKHRAAFWKAGTLGWVALPNILIFQILLPLVSPFIDLMFVFGTVTYLIDRKFHPETANSASFQRLVVFFVLFLVIDFITSAIAFSLERKEARRPEDTWLLAQVWLQRFAYRQLFSVVLFKTLKRAVDGRPFAWDKLERTARLTHVAG